MRRARRNARPLPEATDVAARSRVLVRRSAVSRRCSISHLARLKPSVKTEETSSCQTAAKSISHQGDRSGRRLSASELLRGRPKTRDTRQSSRIHQSPTWTPTFLKVGCGQSTRRWPLLSKTQLSRCSTIQRWSRSKTCKAETLPRWLFGRRKRWRSNSARPVSVPASIRTA